MGKMQVSNHGFLRGKQNPAGGFSCISTVSQKRSYRKYFLLGAAYDSPVYVSRKIIAECAML